MENEVYRNTEQEHSCGHEHAHEHEHDHDREHDRERGRGHDHNHEHGRHGGGRKHASHRIPPEELKDDSVICRCRQITYGMVKQAAAGGSTTADEVAAANGTELLCRKCVDYMESLMKDLPR